MENERTCPVCGRKYGEPPATSRRDGREICDECGIMEAADDAGFNQVQKDDLLAAIRDAKRRGYKMSHRS